jgi:hypothetical protein
LRKSHYKTLSENSTLRRISRSGRRHRMRDKADARGRNLEGQRNLGCGPSARRYLRYSALSDRSALA